MSAIVYLDRDNRITFRLTQDGVPVKEDVVLKASLWIPGTAFDDGQPQVVDTDGEYVSFTDSNTAVVFALGPLDIKTGSHACYLTIYDGGSPNGYAWDRIHLRVRTWPAEV